MSLKENTMRCAHVEDLLPAFLEEDLSPQEKRIVEKHLKSCKKCQQFMARLDSLDLCFEELSLSPEQSGDGESLKDRNARLQQIHKFSGVKEVGSSSDIFTPEEVATYLKVSVAAVYEMASEMPFFYFGNDLRIRRERLVQWIDEQELASHRKALAVVGGRL